MTNGRRRITRERGKLLLDLLAVFLLVAILIRPLFGSGYLSPWSSIESTFISDGRFLAAHWPHPQWQPLWYCGTRFDYVYPPLLRYGTALLANFFVPVHAYDVFCAVMFCIGIASVYFLVRVMSGSRVWAWYSAVACALVSPSFVFIKEMRWDASYGTPARLGVMIRYGEGPHISSLAFLPFALGFAFLGLQRGRSRSLVLAGVFSALVALTNFYGATALAIFYPVLVWSLWVGHRDKGIWLRALAIPALAFGLSAFWLTPSYFNITLYNLRYVSEPGNQYSYVLAVLAVLAFGTGSLGWAGGKPQLMYRVFAAGSLLFLSLDVLGHYYFNFRIIGEPHRLVPELDMAIILCAVEALRLVWALRSGAARAFVIATALGVVWIVHPFVFHAWKLYPKQTDYQKHVEYRLQDWMATHMPNSRTFVTGSTRFWWDAWHDNAEVGGGSEQGIMNPNPEAAKWEIRQGSDPESSIRWLQSLGADAIVVSDEHSQDAYHDFKAPHKFAGVLPVLFDDHEGNVIYGVPRRYVSLARVVDTATSKSVQSGAPGMSLEVLPAYHDLVEKGPDSPTATRWNGADSISVHANVRVGQSVLVQVTYDPAWHAYSGSKELPIRQDAMDFMVVDAPSGTHDLDLVFSTPEESRLCYGITVVSLLISGWMLVAPALNRRRD